MTLSETLMAMRACLLNNSPAARGRAQFQNTMESLIRIAREQVSRQDAELVELRRKLRELEGRNGTC